MARNTVICVNEDGVMVEIGHRERRFEFGQVLHTNRWYYQRLMELYPGDFTDAARDLVKDHKPGAEAEAKGKRKRGRPEGSATSIEMPEGSV